MEVNKEELRRLAGSSQQWGEEIGESEWYDAGSFQKPFFGVPDAQFIAAASPAAILSLLEESAQLRAENERIRRELTSFRNNASISGSQIEWIDQILSKEGSANP